MIKIFIRSLLFFQILFSQGSVLLVGGGSENYSDWSDIPYGWLVQHAPNKKILVLHYSTVSTFLPDYFKSLGAAQSVSTFITSATANDSSVFKMILDHDGIFLRGGDQWEYVKQWKGTLTERAIDSVFRRGGAIGGTSAGAMVLSRIIADAKTTSVDPRTSIRTPLNSGITFTEDFLGFALGILCDTHFYERGRLARLLAMLAVYHQQSGKWITGVGIDDATALGITSNGTAEVFGSGVVSFILPDQKSSARVLSGKPLGLSDVTLRQFTKGTTITLPAGDVLTLPSMASFTPIPVSTVHQRLILDGSSNPAEWITPSGSLMKIASSFSGDSLVIITSNAAHAHVTSVRDFLTSKGIPSSIITVSPAFRNAEGNATLFQNRSTFIIVNVASDSLTFFTDSTSVAGNALRESSGKTILMVGEAASFAGVSFVNKLEVTTTAAYRGRLTVEKGLGIMKGMLFLPRLYESDSYIENRACGLPWGIAKSRPSYGIYLDNGAHCVIENGSITAFGNTPIVIFDVRMNSLTTFPTYVASGGIGPRQNAAFNSAKVYLLPDSASMILSSSAGITERRNAVVPAGLDLLNIYPNPFNPSATVEFILQQKAFVTVTLSDVLGRTILIIAQREFGPGNHRLELNGTSLTSGLYFVSMKMNGTLLTKRAMLIK